MNKSDLPGLSKRFVKSSMCWFAVVAILLSQSVFADEEDRLTRFKLDWPVTLCSRHAAVSLKLGPLSLIRAFTEAQTTARQDPSQALMQLGEALHLTWQEMPRTHPLLYRVVGRLAGLSLRDSGTLLRRLNTILFLHAKEPDSVRAGSQPGASWASTGIASYIQSQLFFDPAYRAAMLDFLRNLRRADQEYLAAERTHVSQSAYGYMTFEMAMGPRNRSFQQSGSGFDVLGEMIKSASNALGSDRQNADELGLLVHKMLLYFHDDTQHFPRVNPRTKDELVGPSGILDERAFEEFEQIRELDANVMSLMYTDWSSNNVTNELNALEFLYNRAIQQNFREFNLTAIRWGNYHITAAAGLHGLLGHGLYRNLPGKSWAISLLQKKLAIAYRAVTQDSYEHHEWEPLIDNDIRRRQPGLYRDFLDGTLKLSDVMGRRRGDGFEGGYFNNLFQSDQELGELARTNGLDPQNAEVISGLREAVLYRQVRFLQLIRTISQHAAGGVLSRKVTERINGSL